MVHKDAIRTGINPLRFGDTDIEAVQQLNSHLELILSSSLNPSLVDAAEVLKTKIILPPTDAFNHNIRRWRIWSPIVLPANHSFSNWLIAQNLDIESFRSKFAAYVTVDSLLAKAKGIYYHKYMATEATEYFKEQFRSLNAVALPAPYAIRKFIQREQRWEPILS